MTTEISFGLTACSYRTVRLEARQHERANGEKCAFLFSCIQVLSCVQEESNQALCRAGKQTVCVAKNDEQSRMNPKEKGLSSPRSKKANKSREWRYNKFPELFYSAYPFL